MTCWVTKWSQIRAFSSCRVSRFLGPRVSFLSFLLPSSVWWQPLWSRSRCSAQTCSSHRRRLSGSSPVRCLRGRGLWPWGGPPPLLALCPLIQTLDTHLWGGGRQKADHLVGCGGLLITAGFLCSPLRSREVLAGCHHVYYLSQGQFWRAQRD